MLDYEVNRRRELEILRLHEKIGIAVAERLDQVLVLMRAQLPAERGL